MIKKRQSILDLEKMVEELPILENFIKEKSFDVINYKVLAGECKMINIFSSKDIRVAKLHLLKGTILPEHLHKVSREWIIVYSGSLNVYIDKENRQIGKGEYIVIDAMTLHSLEAIEDTFAICMVIPPDGGFPNAQ